MNLVILTVYMCKSAMFCNIKMKYDIVKCLSVSHN